ncbi:MAG: hypothetical protein RLZZ210_1828 [Pseudomonadota bacterium]|jgi:hypothetical protein
MPLSKKISKKRYKLFLSLFVSTFLLSACSPDFNWREVHNNNYIVSFPAKPSSNKKHVLINNKKYDLYMEASSNNDMLFGVAYINLDTLNGIEKNSTTSSLVLDLQKQWCKYGKLQNDDSNLDKAKILTCNLSSDKYNKILKSKWITTNKNIYQISVIYDKAYENGLTDKKKDELNQNIDFFFSSFKPA